MLTLKAFVAVAQDVLVQGLGVLKDFLALVTHEVVLLAVDLHVDVEGVGVREHLVADVTGLQSLACVEPHVVFEFLFLAEHDVTDGTGLPLLSSVGLLVRVASSLRHNPQTKPYTYSLTLSLNVISQKLHLYGFIPRWIRICLLRAIITILRET